MEFTAMRLAALVSIVILATPLPSRADSTCLASPEDRCQVRIEEVCSPLCHQTRGCCQVDSTRWAVATYIGACGTEPAEWEIRPDPKTNWPTHGAQAFQFGNSPNTGYFRGECGPYLVRAKAPDTNVWSEELPVFLPADACEARR